MFEGLSRPSWEPYNDRAEDASLQEPDDLPTADDFAPYIEAGYELIPLHRWDYTDRKGRERGKSPIHPNWRSRPLDMARLEHWTTKRGGNFGVRLRETEVVIDHDPRNVPEGVDAISELERRFGLGLATWPHVETGSGGDHWYGRLPEGVRVLNSLEDIPGIEFKSAGRQVVAAGSKHPNGNIYTIDDFAPPFTEAPLISDTLLEAIRRPERVGQSVAPRIPIDHLRRCLDQLDVEEYRDHDIWLELMLASHYAVGGDPAGRDVFVAWSTSDEVYSGHGEEIAVRWDSLDPDPVGGVTTATLYKHVGDAGGTPIPPPELDFEPVAPPQTPGNFHKPKFERLQGGKPTRTVPNAIEAICGLGIQPTRNNLTHRDMIAGPGAEAFYDVFPGLVTRELTDVVGHALAEIAFRRWRLDVSADTMMNAASRMSLQHATDPLVDFLNGLEWDGTKRLGGWLVRYAGAEPSAYTQAVGRVTLMGAIARAYRPGIEFQTMTVLEGPQGTYKSTLVRILGGEWTLPGLPHLKSASDKDVVDAMLGKWLVEVDELENLRKADIATMKAFLSRESDTVRLAYARRTETYPRRCVFIGTTNEAEYLRDQTGNRRFLPVRIGRIDSEALEADRDQLWAEAALAWRENPSHNHLMLDISLWNAAAEEQERRRLEDPAEEVVAEYLRKHVNETWIAAADILVECFSEMNPTSEASRRITQTRLPGIMLRLGWRKSQLRKNSRRGYEIPSD